MILVRRSIIEEADEEEEEEEDSAVTAVRLRLLDVSTALMCSLI